MYLASSTGILGDVGHSAPDRRNKASRNPLAGQASCLQFVKNAASVKHNKAEHGICPHVDLLLVLTTGLPLRREKSRFAFKTSFL